VTRFLVEHHRQDDLRALNHCNQVEVYFIADLFWFYSEQGFIMTHPSIIKKYVDPAPPVECALNHPLNIITDSHIRLHDKSFPTENFDIESDLFKSVQATSCQRQAHPITRQSPGDSCANPTGCASDDDDLAVK
jgi:hypothetical protein